MSDPSDTVPIDPAFSARVEKARVENKRTLGFSLDWIARPFFGLALAAIAACALWLGGYALAAFICLGIVAAAREWHRMVSGHLRTQEFFVTSIAIVAGVFLFVVQPGTLLPWLLLLAGGVVCLALAVLHGRPAVWEAGGVLYLGIPALALIALRTLPEHGFLIVLAMFVAIWASDTGALIVGRLVGGPKLWPALSPNKTWAGVFGGTGFAAIAGAGAFALAGLSTGRGAIFAACVGTIAHGGDLFESWAKRSFGIKDSGGLIPGHGGVLDRIDSTLLVVPLLAIAVLIVQFDPLGAY